VTKITLEGRRRVMDGVKKGRKIVEDNKIW
jgi:hypothetical protein